MATEYQDTLKDQAWRGNEGRQAIVAFAERQWRLDERFSHRGISTVLNGGIDGDGGFASHVVATFRGGMTQPMEEVKFIYGCSDHAFAHVEIASAKGAAVR